MTTIIIILIAMLLFCSFFLAFKFGYEKGIHDLTEEIDEGIKRIQKEKLLERFPELHYEIKEQDNGNE